MGVTVIGQIGRDIALRTAQLPTPGGSEAVLDRVERLGGKGANQAVGLTQLGVPVTLLGVVGQDRDGAPMLRQADEDGIDVGHVAARGETALLVTLIDGSRRLLEHIPHTSLVTVEDIDRAAAVIEGSDTVSIQLQQPAATVLAAAHRASGAGARVVADGAVDCDVRDEFLPRVDVLRADAEEAAILAGEPVESVEQATALGRRLLDAGPELIAIALPDAGNLLVWRHGEQFYPPADVTVVDPTGAGDAFVAGLIAGLRCHLEPAQVGEVAARAAASTVTYLGARPDLAALRGQMPPD